MKVLNEVKHEEKFDSKMMIEDWVKDGQWSLN